MKKALLAGSIVLVLALAGGVYYSQREKVTPQTVSTTPGSASPTAKALSSPSPSAAPSPSIVFVGPREGIPAEAPKDYGFWSLALPVPGVLSRSGQPTLKDFKWLKDNGWKSDIDLRVDGERGEVGDDRKIPGFNALGFNYLPLPIADGSPPSEKQAKEFLAFITNPANQPAHVHCRGGIGRTGTMVALYRYAVQGWPMDKAIEESLPFQGGVSEGQKKWLLKWAAEHSPGEFQF